ncbi:hypothetical protein BDZ89DRAFT_1074525, partial [Hymenopellis radicata]
QERVYVVAQGKYVSEEIKARMGVLMGDPASPTFWIILMRVASVAASGTRRTAGRHGDSLASRKTFRLNAGHVAGRAVTEILA